MEGRGGPCHGTAWQHGGTDDARCPWTTLPRTVSATITTRDAHTAMLLSCEITRSLHDVVTPRKPPHATEKGGSKRRLA